MDIVINAKIYSRKQVGRFVNPDTGRPVNVFTGRKSGTSYFPLFFYRSGKKIQILKKDFSDWEPADEEKAETESPKVSKAWSDLGAA